MNSLTRAASREVRVQGRILGNGDGPTMLSESRATHTELPGHRSFVGVVYKPHFIRPNHLKKLVLLNDLED